MIFVYICENDFRLRNIIEKEIKHCIDKKKYQMKIQHSILTSVQILKKIEVSANRGLYFIDMDFGEELRNESIGKSSEDIEAGILLGKEVRKRDARGFIVFITLDKALMLRALSHHIEAVDYIMKEEIEITGISENIRRCLDTVAQRMEDDIFI